VGGGVLTSDYHVMVLGLCKANRLPNR
jgi:hypothetical protein